MSSNSKFLLTTACAFASAKTPTRKNRIVIISRRGRRGEIYARIGKTSPLVTAMRFAAAIPNIPRRVSGYNLPDLLPENGFHVARALVGTESYVRAHARGNCETCLESPGQNARGAGLSRTFIRPAIMCPKFCSPRPIACEAIDALLVQNMKIKGLHPKDLKLLPEGRGWLLVEFGGEDRKDSDNHARGLMGSLKKYPGAPSMKLYDDPGEEKLVWDVREAGLGATAWVPGEPVTWEGWEDLAVAPEKLGGLPPRAVRTV